MKNGRRKTRNEANVVANAEEAVVVIVKTATAGTDHVTVNVEGIQIKLQRNKTI
jgi:hypothetical protein